MEKLQRHPGALPYRDGLSRLKKSDGTILHSVPVPVLNSKSKSGIFVTAVGSQPVAEQTPQESGSVSEQRPRGRSPSIMMFEDTGTMQNYEVVFADTDMDLTLLSQRTEA